MKRAKFFLAAAMIATVVGGALAFKTAQKGQGNLYICVNNKCAFPSIPYSTVPEGPAVPDPPPTYTSTLGAGGICSTSGCVKKTLPVYVNE
jgi:hypothetical protein